MFLGSFATAVEAAVCFAKHVEQQGGMRGRFARGEGGEEGGDEGEEEEGEEEGSEEEESEEGGEDEEEAERAGEGEDGEGGEETDGVRRTHALAAKDEEPKPREDHGRDKRG